MRTRLKSLAIGDFGRIFAQGASPSSDSTLLRRFVERGEETAFEALIARHGPMVRGVCRRLLIDPHDADDAFQATFLVLIRKAGGLRDADRLGPWLYGVATRVATKARSQGARRRDRQGGFAEEVGAPDAPSPDWIDVRPILDDELGQLSPKLRDVLVLCLLEGVTAEEASFRLACPLGTVKSRLARGREALRHRLIRRGVAPGVAAVAASSVFASPVSASLARTTLGLTSVNSAALPTALVSLSKGAATAMIPKSTLMTCLTVGALAFTGVGIASWLRSNVVAQTDAPTGKPAAGVPDDAIERTRRNLQKVLLAIHNYRDTFDIFPPAALYGSEGRPNLSWRVAILPYLNENDLYNEFIKDEPWDSPHNIKLLARMPAVFKTPISPAPEVETRMRGFQGKDAMFDGVVGLRITEVTDGTSNTAMIAVTRQAVPWTKPEEIPFAKGLSTDALLEAGDHGPMVGLADGQVRYAKKGNGVFLGSIITRSGNEAIDWPPKPGDPTNEPPKLVPIPTPTAATQYLPAPLMTVPDTTSSPQPQGGFMPGYGIGQPQLAGKGGMGIAIPDMSGMGRGRQAGGEGMGAAMGGSAATQVLDPLVERRLQSLEAKLDLILKRLEAKPEAQPTPPVRLRQ